MEDLPIIIWVTQFTGPRSRMLDIKPRWIVVNNRHVAARALPGHRIFLLWLRQLIGFHKLARAFSRLAVELDDVSHLPMPCALATYLVVTPLHRTLPVQVIQPLFYLFQSILLSYWRRVLSFLLNSIESFEILSPCPARGVT